MSVSTLRNTTHEYGKIRGSVLLVTVRPMTLEGLTPMLSEDSTSRFCPRGHDTLIVGRYQRRCKECRREDHRAWAAANSEQCAEAKRRWIAEHPDQVRATFQAWERAHADERRAYARAQRELHSERFREKDRRRYQRTAEVVKERNARWKRENMDRARGYYGQAKARRRALIKDVGREPYDYSAVVYGVDSCGLCGIAYVEGDVRSLDHIIPISKGGGDVPANVQSAHRLCNSRKGNRV